VAQPDIFLSYNREDAEVARRFADAFAADGFDVWWDQALRSGEAYDKVTEAALRGAKAVVVLWSPRSVDSRWVRAEATIAERGGTLVPARIEPCDLPVMFELTQTADLTHWQGAADDRAWLAYLGDVRRMVGREAPVPATPSASAPAKADGGAAIVSVLPITPRGGGEELQFLAEDLTEDITRELARGTHLKVTAARVMAAMRGRDFDYRSLRAELGASYLVESKLQKSGDAVRLTLQVIETQAGQMVWSKRLDRSVDEIETAPEQLARAAASELIVNLMEVEIGKAMTKPGPLTGWEHTLRANAYFAKLGSESARKAVEEGRQAVAKAPDLGLAHGILAVALAIRRTAEGEEIDDDARNEIREHVRRAMQLDGENPAIIASLATPYVALGDNDTAIMLARRAVELDPVSPFALLFLGFAQVAAGQTGDAIVTLLRLDHLTSHDFVRYSAFGYLGMAYLLDGKPDQAKQAFDRSLALHPDYHVTLKWKAITAARLGDEELALDTVRRLREAEPAKTIDQHVRQMMVYKGLGERLAEPVATLRRLWDATEGG